MNLNTFVSLLLRIGIAFSFLYAAVQSFRDPVSWIGFLPVSVQDAAEQSIGVHNALIAFSIFEIVLAIWLLLGWRGFWSGLLSAAVIGGIVVVNLGALDIVFRDVSIFFAALAYAFLSRRRN